MNKFEIGQEVYVIYRKKNSKSVNKWYVAEGARKIIDKNGKYVFSKKPLKVKKNEVFADYEQAIAQCEYRNHWGKYHKNVSFRGKRKKK